MEEMSPSKPSDAVYALDPVIEEELDWVNVWVVVVDTVEEDEETVLPTFTIRIF